VIPSNRIASQAKFFDKYMPDPNTASGNAVFASGAFGDRGSVHYPGRSTTHAQPQVLRAVELQQQPDG